MVSDSEMPKALLDAARLLELAGQGEKDIQEGHVMPQEEVFARIRSRRSEERDPSSVCD
jgi:predicted transcriptional regulator